MLSAPGCSSEILFRRCLRRSWLLVAQTVKNLLVMQETRVQSQGQEDHLEKGMAIHSNILAWGIPWTEEPGSPQSMGSYRVGNKWETTIFTFHFSLFRRSWSGWGYIIQRTICLDEASALAFPPFLFNASGLTLLLLEMIFPK